MNNALGSPKPLSPGLNGIRCGSKRNLEALAINQHEVEDASGSSSRQALERMGRPYFDNSDANQDSEQNAVTDQEKEQQDEEQQQVEKDLEASKILDDSGMEEENTEAEAHEAAAAAIDKYKDYLNDTFDDWQVLRGVAKTHPSSAKGKRKRTGLVYDERCLLHRHPSTPHPERPARILSIFETLQASSLALRMDRVPAKPISLRDVERVHSAPHFQGVHALKEERVREEMQFKLMRESAFANEHSTDAALLSAGGVLELTKAVCAGRVRNGLAVVRPPGHHAEHECIKGFCLFNNVAVAAAWAAREGHSPESITTTTSTTMTSELPAQETTSCSTTTFSPIQGKAKVLVVDFDVHHGNGTQKMFYKDPNVLFFSVHRFDHGSFYPGGMDGSPVCVGEDEGIGYNINVGWNGGEPGDAEYLAVWRHVLLPAAYQFNPDLVIVSAGFDAAEGDPLGGCRVTPEGYGAMIHQLMGLANGRVIIALEGGYSVKALSESTLVCAAVLLGQHPPRALPRSALRSPSASAMASIIDTIKAHKAAYINSLYLQTFNPVLRWTDEAILETHRYYDSSAEEGLLVSDHSDHEQQTFSEARRDHRQSEDEEGCDNMELVRHQSPFSSSSRQ